MFASPRTVRDVMTERVVAVGQDTSFKRIVKTLYEWKVSAVPVLEGDARVIGVVSEADLLPKEEYRDSEPARLDDVRHLDEATKAAAATARELMTSPAICVHPDSTVAQAARIMARRHVKRLPVTDAEGRLRGIVSRSDLLRVFLRADEDIAAEVHRDVVRLLFPGESSVTVEVRDGSVTLRGDVFEPGLIAVATRLSRAVEGVVDVRCELNTPTKAR